MRIGMTALEACDQLIEKRQKFHSPERARPELLQQRPIQQFEPLGDRQDLADAPRDFGVAPIWLLIGKPLDRGGAGGDAEQAWSRLVVQLVSDRPPLLLLHADELAIEPAVLIARNAERTRERIEAFGERCEFLDLRQSKPRRVVSLFEADHSPGEIGKGVKKAAEHGIENDKDESIQCEP